DSPASHKLLLGRPLKSGGHIGPQSPIHQGTLGCAVRSTPRPLPAPTGTTCRWTCLLRGFPALSPPFQYDQVTSAHGALISLPPLRQQLSPAPEPHGECVPSRSYPRDMRIRIAACSGGSSA